MNRIVYIGFSEIDTTLDPAILYAIDATTGEQEWKFTEPTNGITSSPTIVDGTVYIGGSDGTLYAIDALTGEQKWTFTEVSGSVKAPAVMGGTVYVGGRNALYAVDAATGEQDWMFTEPIDDITSAPTIVDDTVFVGGSVRDDVSEIIDYDIHDEEQKPFSNNSEKNTGLYAVNATTGEKEWKFTEPSEIAPAPTVVNNTVYIGSTDDELYAIDAVTGEKKWEFVELSGSLQSPTVMENTVYIGSEGTLTRDQYDPIIEGAGLYAIDRVTGEQKWKLSTSNRIISSPTVMGDTVYIGGSGMLYAINATTGEQVWEFTEPASRVVSSPTVVETPTDGDSAGSRVNLGTLGHHHVFAERGPTDPSEIDISEFDSDMQSFSDEDGDGIPGFGVGSTVAALGGVAYLLKRHLTDTDERS